MVSDVLMPVKTDAYKGLPCPAPEGTNSTVQQQAWVGGGQWVHDFRGMVPGAHTERDNFDVHGGRARDRKRQ